MKFNRNEKSHIDAIARVDRTFAIRMILNENRLSFEQTRTPIKHLVNWLEFEYLRIVMCQCSIEVFCSFTQSHILEFEHSTNVQCRHVNICKEPPRERFSVRPTQLDWRKNNIILTFVANGSVVVLMIRSSVHGSIGILNTVGFENIFVWYL